MWTELPTAYLCVSCEAPFSFYFDVVDVYWKTPHKEAVPLHRICTLARKQGATFIIVESGLARQDVRDDITSLDLVNGGGGSADAISLTFFKTDVSPEELESISSTAILAQAVIINYRPPNTAVYSSTYIFEAVLPPPTLAGAQNGLSGLLNNYVSADGQFNRTSGAHSFTIQGVYYCQQNSMTHVCAHACLRMVLNSLGGSAPEVTNQEINKFLQIAPPINGLQLGQLVSFIKSRRNAEVPIIDCSGLDPQTYVSALAAYVESGYLALLVFTTAGVDEHVVTVFGHTRNSDQWHPQAIPAYGGPRSAAYYSGSAWISHFLIHDDNFGPYYTLSSRALDANPAVKAHWIIPVVPEFPTIAPHLAEVVAAVALSNNLSALSPLSRGKWFDYITRTPWKYVLRTLLVERVKYMDHLKSLVAHDGTRMTDAEVNVFSCLPDRFWMVEFSLPALFTGNRSKLGEVLIDSQVARTAVNALDVTALRLPNLLFIKDTTGDFRAYTSSMTSHAPIYRVRQHGQEW